MNATRSPKNRDGAQYRPTEFPRVWPSFCRRRRAREIISAAWLWLIIISTPANALEISYSRINPFDGSSSTPGEGLLLRGEIGPGDYDHLLNVIRQDEERFWRSSGFVLASPGGDIEEALLIARLVRRTFSSAYVGKATGPCVSACFFIYSSSVRRLAGARTLGIHRPYIHPRRLRSMSITEAEAAQQNALRRARSYLENQDIPTSLIDRMFQQASTEVYWLSPDEIEQQVGRRPPWYEQFLISRCGLDKSIERKYFSGDHPGLLDQLMEVNRCGDRLSIEEAREFLRLELHRSAGALNR